NGFLHAFIISYTKEKGNAHSSPTYSLWSLKWESPARNRMKPA
ncbi:S9 family peptidase, partial [Geobacillus stearothermophilus]